MVDPAAGQAGHQLAVHLEGREVPGTLERVEIAGRRLPFRRDEPLTRTGRAPAPGFACSSSRVPRRRTRRHRRNQAPGHVGHLVTARANAASFAREGRVDPLSFRTN